MVRPHLTIADIAGVWSLLNITLDKGVLPSFNYTRQPFGRIIITADHYFNAMISDLPQVPAGYTWANATDAQKVAIGASLTVYEGPVILVPFDGSYYTHTQVENSYDPEWEVLQIRKADLTKDSNGTHILKLTPWEVSCNPILVTSWSNALLMHS